MDTISTGSIFPFSTIWPISHNPNSITKIIWESIFNRVKLFLANVATDNVAFIFALIVVFLLSRSQWCKTPPFYYGNSIFFGQARIWVYEFMNILFYLTLSYRQLQLKEYPDAYPEHSYIQYLVLFTHMIVIFWLFHWKSTPYSQYSSQDSHHKIIIPYRCIISFWLMKLMLLPPQLNSSITRHHQV